MIFAIEITVEGNERATPELLQAAIDECLRRACRYPLDLRFDWATAQCHVVEPTIVRTPK